MTAILQPLAQAEPADRSDQHVTADSPWTTGPRRSVPSISGLIAFEAAARYLSFSDAARELTLTQGAVSKRVRQLESILGVTLLIRSRQGVVLTELGKLYLVDVRRLLGRIQASTQSLMQAYNRRPAVTVVVPPEVARYWLMPRLSNFYARHSAVVVNLVSWRHGMDTVPPERFDCAIEFIERPLKGHAAAVLFAEEVVPVAAPSFLAANPVTKPSALLGVTLILQAGRQNLWNDWFSAHGVGTPSRLDGTYHDCASLVLDAAVNGHGVALASMPVVRALIERDELSCVFPTPLATGRACVFTIRGTSASRSVVGQFGRWISAAANELE